MNDFDLGTECGLTLSYMIEEEIVEIVLKLKIMFTFVLNLDI